MYSFTYISIVANVLNIHKYTGSFKAIDLYKLYPAKSVLYWIIVYIVNTI